MERSFDFGRLLEKHKCKPSQFKSVAGGHAVSSSDIITPAMAPGTHEPILSLLSESCAASVKKRLETNLKHRKSTRLTAFDHLRDLPICESPKSNAKTKIEHRRQQLEVWKKQKEKQKKEEVAKKKKPFIAGVVHASLKFVPPPPAKPMPSTSGRVTRSQNRNKAPEPTTQSFAPKNATFKPPANLKNAKKLTLAPPKKQNVTVDAVIPRRETRQTRSRATKTETKPPKLETKAIKTTKQKPKIPLKSNSSSEDHHSPILPSKSRKSHTPKPQPIEKKTPMKSLRISNVTPKNGVPKSESSSEERLRSPKSEGSLTPESDSQKISPCVTISRGKDNARREMKKKLDEGLLDEDASDMDSVEHFRKQLASEIKRMTEMCDTWDKIMEQTVLPDAVQEAVLAAVGQARLLMSAKLQQFGALLEACARPTAVADLHGFWDMVFMQVENVDMRFKKLEELRVSNWVVEQVKQEEHGQRKTKPATKKVAKQVAAPSRLREMIAAARKAKKEQPTETPPLVEEKTFDAGFFSVRSPLRASASPREPRLPRLSQSPASLLTPGRHCLLKAVLSSEAKKASASKNSASFAMLRASVLSKNYECDGVAPIPQTPLNPVNLFATPGRSILKSNANKSNRKSIKVVLFDNDEEKDSSYHTTEDTHTVDTVSDLVEDKENSKKKLIRQDAEDRSPVLTRSRRRSVNPDDGVTPRRSARKKVQDLDEEKTPTRTSRRRKSALQVQN